MRVGRAGEDLRKRVERTQVPLDERRSRAVGERRSEERARFLFAKSDDDADYLRGVREPSPKIRRAIRRGNPDRPWGCLGSQL